MRMNKISQFPWVALSCLPLLLAASSFGQSSFDGTWKNEPSKEKRDPKPVVHYIAQGWYHCESCVPPWAVKADGTDQPVSNQDVDTVSVKEVDAKTVAVVGKKDTKVAFEQTVTVSADGKTLTVKGVAHPPNSDKPVEFTTTLKRVGTAHPDVHATSGRWLVVGGQASENAQVTTYKTNGDELTMTRPTGESYTAKFDGKDYPVKGSFGYDQVSLKRVNGNSFEETDELNGKVIEVDTWTVSKDGKTLTVVAVEKPSERTNTYVATKMSEKK
jgi:hypothetical protein